MVQTDSLKRLVVVCGPTASGKTQLAVKIAKLLNSEIVSADSVAVYKGLDIGSAKPTEEERKDVRHNLIDVLSPDADFSVAEYEDLALREIERISSEGKIPVLCGGTGYFIDSVLYKKSYGCCPKNDELRREFKKIFVEDGASALFDKLRAVDPKSCEKLNENDFLRVSRALEIYYLIGKRKSEIKDDESPRFSFIAFSIDHERSELYRRIEERVEKMFDQGLIKEVENLLNSGVSFNAQSMQGIGYKEVAEGVLTGKSIEEIIETVKRNTRRYAKRQITYFKRMKNLYLLPSENAFEKAVDILKNERFIY